MDDLILPGGKRAAKQRVELAGDNVAAKLVVGAAGDVTITGPDAIIVPEAGVWMVVSGRLWASMVNELMHAVTQAELEHPISRRARRRQAAKDRRN